MTKYCEMCHCDVRAAYMAAVMDKSALPLGESRGWVVVVRSTDLRGRAVHRTMLTCGRVECLTRSDVLSIGTPE